MLYRISVIAFVFALLDLFSYEGDKSAIWQAATDIGPLFTGSILGLFAGLLASTLGKALLFRWKRFTNTMYLWIVVIMCAAAMVIAVLICAHFQIAAPLLWTLLLSGVYALIYKMVIFVMRYKKYGAIKKPSDAVSIRESVKVVMGDGLGKQELLNTLIKDYEKKNQRLERKGKEIVSPQAFTESIRDSLKWEKYEAPFCVILCVILTVGAVIVAAGDTHGADLVIYTLLMLVAEGVIAVFFYKAAKSGYRSKREWLEQCDGQGITLPELAARLKAEKADGDTEG